jgi:hypothetical protein
MAEQYRRSLQMTAAAVLALLSLIPIAQAHGTRSAIRVAAGVSAQDETPDRDAASSKFIAAAEPFETLTEEAFSADPARIRKLSAEAQATGRRIHNALPRDAAKALDARLKEIGTAQEHHDRYALAIAAVEAFRILVTEASHAVVPVEVSLLDYAGFRYTAGLKADPMRWADMKAAVDFASETWSAIVARVSDDGLKAKVEQALARMKRAVEQRSAKAARDAAAAELNLVDKLENHFSQNVKH